MIVNTPRREFIMRDDCTVGFGDSGFYVRMWQQRDATILNLHHDTMILSSQVDPHSRRLCTCSKSSRAMTESEKVECVDLCPRVTLWQVDWQDSYDMREIDGVGNLRRFLQEFFEYWQSGAGRGCYIDGVWKDARVEIYFGGSSFNQGG